MSKTIIPFGDRILIKRRVVGEKLGKEGIIYAADTTKETKTDIADVVYVPDHTFFDNELISKSGEIASALARKASEGDSNALKALLEFNIYLKIKSIKVGDAIMVGRYSGINFHDNKGSGDMTLVRGDDIIAVITEKNDDK